MPIYEFYCEHCNTVFNFFSRSVNTQTKPACPRCQGPLKRQMSIFAKMTKGTDTGQEDETLPFDETRLQNAMAMLESEAEKMDTDDPRQAARLMRKLSKTAGISFGEGMEDALNRLERGDDPDLVDEEMGTMLEEENPFLINKTRAGAKKPAPVIDDAFYDL